MFKLSFKREIEYLFKKDVLLIMIPGVFNTMTILRETSVGLFLGDEDEQDVLLPNKYVPDEYALGDEIEVFIYFDSEDRPIATNLIPEIQLNQFAELICVDTAEIGAFMDWGLEKQLFIPYGEQRERIRKGDRCIVYLKHDEKSNRLVGSTKYHQFVSNDVLTVQVKDEVDLLVVEETDLGFNVLVNEMHIGLVYRNQVFKPIVIGQREKGYVHEIREDNKLDIRLHKIGKAASNDGAELILEALEEEEFIPLHDKSAPELIYSRFRMSKKHFKRAIGTLYKEKKIEIKSDGIQLNKE